MFPNLFVRKFVTLQRLEKISWISNLSRDIRSRPFHVLFAVDATFVRKMCRKDIRSSVASVRGLIIAD